MKIGVLGGGESGVGAALLAKSEGHIVIVSDYGKIADRFKKELIENNIRFEEGGHSFEILETLDLIIKSPGIPDTSAVINHLKDKGLRIIGEIEFGYLQCGGKIIAITGTNGKTTTTNLTYEMMQNQFAKVGKGGNVGYSFCRLVLEDDYEWYVLELSSFQLDGCHSFKPEIACILNVTPDHLDRYEDSMALYRASKASISKNQNGDDYLFISDDLVVKKALSKARSKIISLDIDNGLKDLKNPYLKGHHNALNAAFAKEMSGKAGVSNENIEKALESFVNHDHRLQPVARINEVLYINDSKATNVDATYYALTAFEEPIIWIVGGRDKGNDYSALEQEVRERVKAIVMLGEDNSKISSYFKGKIEKIKDTSSMTEAISAANEWAESGDVVLLSPACASFDLFENYEDRGKQFVEEVWKLIEED